MNDFGLIHIYCGNGKGKTTCAAGLCLRASGRGKKCLWTSFLKDYDSGEFMYPSLPFDLFMGREVNKFVFLMSDEEKKELSAEHSTRLKEVFERAEREGYDLLVLDEIIATVNLGLVPVDDLVSLLKNKPDHLEVVLTGRDPKPELVELADYVSEIFAKKHPYESGIASRTGIEK